MSSISTSSPEYMPYRSMIRRCTEPTNTSYKYYGARGVTVSPEWTGAGGFKRFVASIGRRPSLKYSIDRIDSNGNYEPGNVQWATKTQQVIKRRKFDRNTSGYTGVYYDSWTKAKKKWIARIGINRFYHNLGTYLTPEEAALQYDRAVIFFHGGDGRTNIL